LSEFCNWETSAKCEALTDGLYIIQMNFRFHGVNIVHKDSEEEVGLQRTLQIIVTLIKISKPFW